MMEDNSEAQMETDVSSTTTDVTDMQEISGSNDVVETIIVIEKIQDEDSPDSLQQSADIENIETNDCVQSTQSCEGTSKIQTDSLQTSITNSPQRDKQKEEDPAPKVMSPSIVEKSPTKSTSPSPMSCMDNSPTKSTSPPVCEGKSSITSIKSPSPLSCVQKSPNKSTKSPSPVCEMSPVKTISSSMPTPIEVADSSCDVKNNEEDKIQESQEKIIQVENSKTISDHQYAAKEQPEEEEQVNQPDQKAEEEKKVIEPEIVESQNQEGNVVDNKSIVKDVDTKIDESTISSITSEKETSIESQNEASSDISEKEHNKSISRELKSLIKSAKESKIISECTQLTSKTRKSRTPLDASLTSLVEVDKVQGTRRSSTNSQLSTCSEKSEKANIKRSMRSQNPEFVHKVKQFLNSVTGKSGKNENDNVISDEESEDSKNDNKTSPSTKTKITTVNQDQQDGKLRSDLFCWRCHWQVEQGVNERTHHPMQCTICPRSFHYKCLSGTERNKITNDKSWVCPECLSVLTAESSDTRSPAMKKISLGMLCDLLKFALERLMDFNGAEPFMQPVDRATFPDYDKYVVHPMDLSLMKKNISDGLYGSTEAFLADTQWIFHNSIIFNTSTSKLTGHARALVRMCRTEMAEIEACPECYAAAHARRPTWFTDVCSTPHILLWAKLKGFPHWPAKAMSVNSSGLVDVRFFGAHDRAWVPSKDCYLYSEKDPNNFRTKRQDILDSMQEAELHIRNISRKYGKFVYPPFKTQFDPTKLSEQLKMMIPSFDGEVSVATKEKSGGSTQNTGRDKSRSNSKSSKSSSTQDGDVSEGEEMSVTRTRKMADGAEIAKEEDYSINDKSMEIDMVSPKKEPSRKRRRSDLEEAVVTILSVSNSPIAEKRKRANVEAKVNKNEETKEKITVSENKPDKTTKDEAMETTNNDDNEPSSSTSVKENSTEPNSPKIIIKVKLPKTSTPKNKDKNNIDEITTTKKQPKLDKTNNLEKEDKPKSEKRRNSKNKVLNNNGDKIIKIKQYSNEKKTLDKDVKDDNINNKTKEFDGDKTVVKKIISKANSEEQKTANAAPVDDDISLAVIARESKTNIINNNITGLPTISSVRSLLIPKSNESNSPKTVNTPATTTSIEITIEDTSESSIFTPTSTDNVRNMKEAVTKLQKLRNDTDPPPVGRVGVRAFARMSSLEITPKEKNPIQVEIKSEPIDLDDIDRHNEKMNLMNAFKLQPVNPPVSTSLREVRINKVVVAPINTRKTASKPPEIRVRAKKTFPQPKKSDDGRSELNGKNSMVYIPIQPPVTQAPVRGVRPIATNCLNAPNARPAPVVTSANGVNPCPVLPFSMPSSMPKVGPATTNTCNVLSTVPTAGLNPSPVQVPTVGQVATNVHTVPLLTSLNGQWTFSLQPVMSVGGLDDSPTSVLNGISERCSTGVSAGGSLPSFPSPLALASPNVASSTPPVTSATPGNRNDTPGELPRLQQRPLVHPLDASAPLGAVPPPSTAGPLTAKLNQNAVKLTDFFRTLLEESLDKIDEPAAQATTARLQLEQAKWLHQQEISELKHNHELIVAEMRATFEKEKSRAVNEVRRAAQQELEAAVKLAKSKQWCSNCSKEAQFYCCWNTSYCDYPCQRAHWTHHYSVCTQQRQENDAIDGSPTSDGNKSTDSNKPMPVLQKSTPAAPALAPVRVYTQDQSAQKPSIIVSMFEDSTGNQTMKCVGTYKPPGPPKLSPLNVNKKVINPDDSTKKVVTSGGYLIVGGSSNAMTRRPQVQYYT
ncbi:protein kinase C-binding protein 1-like isoform X1 [Papilio machaon]|uniref:protein kinase C-binding protein 1-like isoform X1 n=1 Tax=Papilio machaon TaxID=76193 RepID=UPI001E66480F|nr:protein kinase C-binding protein 1-like isoform X1 [Papilio machaon]